MLTNSAIDISKWVLALIFLWNLRVNFCLTLNFSLRVITVILGETLFAIFIQNAFHPCAKTCLESRSGRIWESRIEIYPRSNLIYQPESLIQLLLTRFQILGWDNSYEITQKHAQLVKFTVLQDLTSCDYACMKAICTEEKLSEPFKTIKQ